MDNYENIKQSLYLKRFPRTASNFETKIWDLFDASDWNNKQRLGLGFPYHYQVYKDWYNCEGGEREFFKEYMNE